MVVSPQDPTAHRLKHMADFRLGHHFAQQWCFGQWDGELVAWDP